MAGLKTYWQRRFSHTAGLPWRRLAGVAILCLGFLPTLGRAQEANLIDVASVTLVPLPNQSIAGIKGTGLQGPGVGSTVSTGGTITLWDELRPPPQPQNAVNGIITITINGVAK